MEKSGVKNLCWKLRKSKSTTNNVIMEQKVVC